MEFTRNNRAEQSARAREQARERCYLIVIDIIHHSSMYITKHACMLELLIFAFFRSRFLFRRDEENGNIKSKSINAEKRRANVY